MQEAQNRLEWCAMGGGGYVQQQLIAIGDDDDDRYPLRGIGI